MTFPAVEKFIKNYSIYNKNITSVKYSILQDFNANDYISILAKLGFGIDKSMPNYKWGKRVFLKNESKLSWISTNKDGYITIAVWDRDNKCRTAKDVKPWISPFNALDHVCSCLGKKSYLRLYKNNDLPSIKSKIKEELLPYKEALNNVQKINNKTFGLSQECYDTIFFDIDNRNEQIATHNLQKLLNLLKLKISDLYYLEQNFFTGGLHCAVKLDKSLHYEDFSELEHHINDQDIHVECNFTNKLLRLPISYEYIPMKLSNDIDLSKEYIDSSYYISSFNEFKTQIYQEKTVLKVSSLLLTDKQVEKYNKYKTYWNTKPKMFIRNIKKYTPTFYPIESGTRWATCSKLVPFCKALGYDLMDIVKIIRSVDKGSKDLRNWDNGRLYNELLPFYARCMDGVVIGDAFKGFVSNADLVDNYISNIIHNDKVIDMLTDKFNQLYCQKRHLKSLSNEKLMIINAELPYFLEEIIGKMIYDINTKKRHKDPKLYYLNGFQLSNTHLERMQDYIIQKLGLRKNPYAKTSIQYLKETLIDIFKFLGMEEINIKNKSKNWMNGCCKAFRVNCITRIYDLMQSLLNKLNYYNNKLNDLKYSINGQYILYILLQGKSMVSSNRDEKWIKDDIPIPILE